VAVVAVHAIFRGPAGGEQPRHPDALAHDAAGPLVWDVC
jgi:hypothetical protein